MGWRIQTSEFSPVQRIIGFSRVIDAAVGGDGKVK